MSTDGTEAEGVAGWPIGGWQRLETRLRQVVLVFALGVAGGAAVAGVSQGPTFIDHMEAAVLGDEVGGDERRRLVDEPTVPPDLGRFDRRSKTASGRGY